MKRLTRKIGKNRVKSLPTGNSDQGSSSPALEIESVRKSHRQGTTTISVLDNVDLRVDAGEFVSLVGPSGSGKSTLLHLAGGLDSPDTGRVRVNGIDLSGLSAGSLARVFQFFQLLPNLTVRENVELPLSIDRGHKGDATDLLTRVGLASKADVYPTELSGGEMQRVAIARSLIARAPLILADEPTGNLDSVNAGDVLNLLAEQVRLSGSALLLVTHDRSAAATADRTVYLKDGCLGEGRAQ